MKDSKNKSLFLLIYLLVSSFVYAESSSSSETLFNKYTASRTIHFRIAITAQLSLHLDKQSTKIYSNAGSLLISRKNQPTLMPALGHANLKNQTLEHTAWVVASP